MRLKYSKIDIFINIVTAIIIAAVMSVYVNMTEIFTGIGGSLTSRMIKSVLLGWQTYVFFALILVIMFLAAKYHDVYAKALSQLYRFRFLIAAAVFVLCVALGITGSSIGQWCYLSGVKDTDILAGVSRMIRSDEWAVSIPMNISQFFHNDGFDYFSNSINGTLTDFFIGYRQPVYSVFIIFKPFLLGYLFLPAANAMAFFWAGKLIVLLLVTFEFGMIITKGNKRMSIITALLISFSPIVQWWFSTTIADTIIYTLLAVILFKKYLETQNTVKRIPYVAGIILCAGCFIMTLYPAWLVPFFYIIVAMIIWLIWENHGKAKMKLTDWGIIALFGAVLAAMIYVIFSKSADAVAITSETVYPGNRLTTGGGAVSSLFGYVTNLWGALIESLNKTNVCEQAAFITFFPVSYIAAGVALIRDKIKDKFLICMIAVSIFLGCFCIFTWPEWLAKITFMTNSTSGRTLIAFGFVNVLILIRSISILKKSVGTAISFLIALGAGVMTTVIAIMSEGGFTDSLDSWKRLALTFACIIVITVGFYLILRIKEGLIQKIFYRYIVIIVLVSGAIVNPIRMGIDSVYGLTIVEEVRDICEEDEDSLWAMVNTPFPYNNVPLLAGAKTINATNVYPNLELWETLDTTKGNADIYNRYAHVMIYIQAEGDTKFKLENADAFSIDVTVEMLKEVGVKYLLSRYPIEKSIVEADELELINNSTECCIYEIK